jgi:hypothetical protein
LNPKVELAVMAVSELRADVAAELWCWALASVSGSFDGVSGGGLHVSGAVWDPSAGWAAHLAGLADHAAGAGRGGNGDHSSSSDRGSGNSSSGAAAAAQAAALAAAAARAETEGVCAGQGWLAMALMLSHVGFGAFTVCMTIGKHPRSTRVRAHAAKDTRVG